MPDDEGPSGFVPPAIEDLNQWLSSYEFIELIACGGMGAVYRARQISLDRMVAIKILPPELAVDESFRASFEAEGKAMAKVTHSNLVGVYDFGKISDMLYLVMEFVEGSNLYESMGGEAIDTEVAVTLIAAVASGLAEAHQHDLVHRDIKPANILINTDVVPKLGDFGLAVPDSDIESGLMMGTPAYLAPEVLADPRSASFASDTYALGVILYEMLTGSSIERGDVVDFAKVPRSGNLLEILRKALNPQALSRYQDAGLFEEDLKEWLRKPKRGGLAVSPAGAAIRPNHTPVLSSNSSGGGGGVLAAFVLLAVVGGLGWMYFGKDSGESSAEKETPEEKVIVALDPVEKVEEPSSRPQVALAEAPEMSGDPVSDEAGDSEEMDDFVKKNRFRKRNKKWRQGMAGIDPNEEAFRDPEAAALTEKYREALVPKIEALEAGYLRVLGEFRETYESQGSAEAVQQIDDEVSRVESLRWRSGFLVLRRIPPAGELPSHVVTKKEVFRSEFEKRYEPIQSTYVSALERIVSRKKAEGATDLEELEELIEDLKVPEGAVWARFVKIESLPDEGIDNAVISTIDILDGEGERLPRENFLKAQVSSAQTQTVLAQNRAGRRAIDGNPETRWGARWKDGGAPFPHWLSFNLGKETWITGFELMSRGPEFVKRNSDFTNWRFSVSLDGENWTVVAKGNFPKGPQVNVHVGLERIEGGE